MLLRSPPLGGRARGCIAATVYREVTASGQMPLRGAQHQSDRDTPRELNRIHTPPLPRTRMPPLTAPAKHSTRRGHR